MSPTVKISLLYVCFSVLYIVFSDYFIVLFLPDISIIEASKFQTLKGILFVISSGSFLFLVTNRYFRKLKNSDKQTLRIHEINERVFESVNESIGVINDHGSFVYHNQSLLKLIKFSEETGPGDIHVSHISQDKIRSLANSFLKGRANQHEQIVETEEKRWIRIFLKRIEASDNLTLAFLRCEDITSQKNKEIQLLESEKDLLSILEMIPLGVLLFDREGTLKFNNKKSKVLLKSKQKDITIRQLPFMLETTEKMVLSDYMNDAFEENNEMHLKCKLMTSSGRDLWVQFDAYPINRDEKKGYIVLFTDISSQVLLEQKNFLDSEQLKLEVKKRTKEIESKTQRLEESQRALTYLLEDVNEIRDELLQANNLLASANKELEAFSYSVSHDLRAPLRSINGFSQAIIDDYGDKLDDTGKDYLDRIRNGALKMGALIDDMLVLSRISRKEMQFVNVDITVIAKEKIKELCENEPDRVSDIKIQEGIMCCGDMNLIKILFSNLLENAWKFTSRENCAEIDISFKSGEILVRDNGVGFDTAFTDKIFEPFQRLHSPKIYKGTGIGLAIVKRIINRHDGQIRVNSEPGVGTTFFIKFPPKG